MKKFKSEKISKVDVYARHWIAAVLTVFLATGVVKGFFFYFLSVLIILLVFSAVVEKSILKARFYPNK